MKNFLFIFFIFANLQTSFAQTNADTLHVSHYNLNLDIRNFSQQEISGYAELTIEAKKSPLTFINLDLKTLTVDSVRRGTTNVTFSQQGAKLRLNTAFSSVGQTATIRIYYHGKPSRDASWGGFYFTTDCAYNMGVGMASIPHSFGRVWFPCIDEFTDKSTYTFVITTDADKKAVCGGMLTDSVNLGSTKRWTWQLTDPIPTYLASVAVANFKLYKDTVHSILGILPVEVYATPAYIEKVPGSFINLKKFIHTFEKRWGACRWQRVGYVAVPFNAGAMEHATNIAYPQTSITGGTSSQSLISHELAHCWFGNLITCKTAQNMWINEGFARYAEYLCDEMLDPTLVKYKTGIKNLHFDVLKNAHKSDGGYWALDNIPLNRTYGSTTYDKGGLVAYALREFMGDEKFFSGITTFLNQNQYGNIDSEEFLQKLTTITGVDLHDFFLSWVHQPGFINFNIDSITPISGQTNKYKVAFRQRLQGAEYFVNNQPVDVEFVSATGQRLLIEKIVVSGESETKELTIPFAPIFWAIDPNSKMGDACFDYTVSVNNLSAVSCSEALFRVQASAISGESILRVEHNPFAPDPLKVPNDKILRLADKHFWRVGMLQSNIQEATYGFSYNQTYDNGLLAGFTQNDLVLLYRKDASDDWQFIPSIISGTATSGRLTIDFLLPGEYTLAIGKELSINNYQDEITIFPNPTTGELIITNDKLRITNYDIYDISGKLLHNSTFIIHNSINISHFASGTYFVKLITNEGIIVKKIVKL